jgi:hypothetical protein
MDLDIEIVIIAMQLEKFIVIIAGEQEDKIVLNVSIYKKIKST